MTISSKERYRRFRRGQGAPAVKGAPIAGRSVVADKPDWDARKRYLGRYRRWLWPHRWQILAVFGLATVAGALDLILPYAWKIIVDDVLLSNELDRAQKFGRLQVLGVTLVVVMVLQQGAEALRTYWMSVLNARVILRIRQRLFEHLLRQPLAALNELKIGGILSRLSGDVDEVSGLLQTAVVTPGVAVLRIVMMIGVLLYLNLRMALIASVMIPPVVLVSILYLRRMRLVFRSMRQDRAETDARAAETFGGIRVVRVFGRERKEARDYAVGHHTAIRKQVHAGVLQLVVTAGWGLLIPMANLCIVWYGGMRYLQGRISIGAILAFQMYVFMLLHPVAQLIFSYGAVQRALAALERTFSLLDQPVDRPDPPDAVTVRRPIRELVFDDVGFEYRPGVPVLRHFSLTVPAGQTVALVGPSGAGKTTVTDLVARFYTPTRGAIRLDGVDLRQVKLASYRRLLGTVQQEIFLFDGTVRENIAFSRRGATDAQIVDAAIRANAHEFITQLPEGYDTVIGERGFKLSGGERQRLSIGRALLADPEILILDEATSSLDSESEQLIQASLAGLLAGRTTFVIAHRLSTIRHADLIVVMDDGQIVELGRHEELVAARGRYHEMISLQLRFKPDAHAGGGGSLRAQDCG